MNEINWNEITSDDNENILTCEITHDDLEVVAGKGGQPNYSAYQTISYPTWSSTCQCGC